MVWNAPGGNVTPERLRTTERLRKPRGRLIAALNLL
jgi:hypothetical protein